MVRLSRIEPDGVEVYAKLEALNPGGSVKDRIGVAMIDAAERDGLIEPGRTTIVEATSGNTGIALAFVCAAKGYDLILILPQGMSREREGLLRLYGAEVRITESLGGMNEAVDAARELAQSKDMWLPDQFSNPANPEIHRRTTGPEIWAALDERVDAFVAGVGTGGTITGAGGFLKERNPAVRIVAVEPAGSAVLSGRAPGPHKIQGIGAGFVPQVLDRDVIDEVIDRGRRGSDRHRAPARPPRGRAGRDLMRRGGVGGAGAGPPARDGRQADRGRAARLGRALRLDAVLRSVEGVVVAQAPRLGSRPGSVAGIDVQVPRAGEYDGLDPERFRVERDGALRAVRVVVRAHEQGLPCQRHVTRNGEERQDLVQSGARAGRRCEEHPRGGGPACRARVQPGYAGERVAGDDTLGLELRADCGEPGVERGLVGIRQGRIAHVVPLRPEPAREPALPVLGT